MTHGTFRFHTGIFNISRDTVLMKVRSVEHDAKWHEHTVRLSSKHLVDMTSSDHTLRASGALIVLRQKTCPVTGLSNLLIVHVFRNMSSL